MFVAARDHLVTTCPVDIEGIPTTASWCYRPIDGLVTGCGHECFVLLKSLTNMEQVLMSDRDFSIWFSTD